jgi:predicted phage terminase large subunit-like protein
MGKYSKELANAIWHKIKYDRGHNEETITAIRDLTAVVKVGLDDESQAMRLSAKYYADHVDDWMERHIPRIRNKKILNSMYSAHGEFLRMYARYNFDSYCRYLEWDRDPDKKFYMPRRKVLKRLAEEMQRLYEGSIRLLCISLPPGVGKTCLALFFITWWAGLEPEKEILTGSHNNSFLEGAYSEVLRIMDKEGEYKYAEIFPDSPVVKTNAKNMMIDVRNEKRFSTLEFCSVGSGTAGKLRASALLYCDDLVSGIEEAMSKERLAKLWESYIIDLRQRKKGGCRELMIATRWSLYDPIGRLEAEFSDDKECVFIREPALDKNDRSRFNYPYGVGFSTEDYHRQRDIMCTTSVGQASWNALYMSEPIEVEGTLYDKSELKRYFELPDGDPDAIISVCDTKDKGDDYAVMPVGYVYGDKHYIVDPVCSDAKIEVIKPLLTGRLIKHKVQQSRFEHNNAGGEIASQVQKAVLQRGGITKITTKYTTANKETKIVVNSDWVKEHCFFLDDSVIKEKGLAEYKRFMDMLTSYSLKGKNKHDDVPDAMAMYALFAQSFDRPAVKILKRLF